MSDWSSDVCSSDLGARQQHAHVERIDDGLQEHLRNIALDDLAGQPFGDGRLADARIADIERIVLRAAAEDLDGALHLLAATDQRIDLSVAGLLVQIHAELLERADRKSTRLTSS